jgi:hypothetical protein
MSLERNPMYKQIINNIIPADDLHWSDEDGKYVSLSRDEIDEVIASCLQHGMEDISDITKVINWCGNVRIGQILWKNFLSGSVGISGFDEHNEPRFIARKGENEYQ